MDSRRVLHPGLGYLGAKHVLNRGFWHHFTKGEGCYLLVTSLHGEEVQEPGLAVPCCNHSPLWVLPLLEALEVVAAVCGGEVDGDADGEVELRSLCAPKPKYAKQRHQF